MTKEQFMYLSIALAGVSAYLYYTHRKTLKSLKGVAGLPADVQKAVDSIK